MRTDSWASIVAVTRVGERVIMGRVVNKIREDVLVKGLILEHVRGHVGIVGNEVADEQAKTWNGILPEMDMIKLERPFEIEAEGMLQFPLHKTWVRHRVPQHHPEDIHMISWR